MLPVSTGGNIPIDPTTEKLIPTNKARRLPWMRGRDGRDVSIETMNRWRLRGLRGVVLESLRCGGTIYTSEEATLRFLERLNAPESPVSRPTTQRIAERSVAEKKLDKAGIQ
jgi:Protein of unknown function (DUF1580)